MKKVLVGGFLVAVVAFPTLVMADTATGTLGVSGTVVSSINLTVEDAGGTFTQGGTDAALSDLGNISKYGTAPTNFTITPGGSSWTLASAVEVMVVQANSASASYTLTAQLGSAPGTVAWNINGVALNSATPAQITDTGAYADSASYPWTIVVPDALASSTSIANVVTFSALSN